MAGTGKWAQKRDAFVNQALEAAGLPLLRVTAAAGCETALPPQASGANDESSGAVAESSGAIYGASGMLAEASGVIH